MNAIATQSAVSRIDRSAMKERVASTILTVEEADARLANIVEAGRIAVARGHTLRAESLREEYRVVRAHRTAIMKVVAETVHHQRTLVRVCNRCGGSGYIAAYAHVENGRCFACQAG